MIDHDHTVSGLSRRNSTIVVPEQSVTLRERDAPPALPHRYDTRSELLEHPQIHLTNHSQRPNKNRQPESGRRRRPALQS